MVATVRAGFTLTELMVALVIAGIIGAALARLVINQARFVAHQDSAMRARAGARAALNVMTSEVRMVTTGGFLGGNRDSIQLRVPYAYGVACSQSGASTRVSLLPADSAMFYAAVPSGYAWRDTLGGLNFVEPATASVSAPASCPLVGITTLSAPGWSATEAGVVPNDISTQFTAVVYLYQTISYVFAESGQLPERRALWRVVASTGARDELVAPFDTSAKFEFLVGNNLTVWDTPPLTLDSVRALRVHLVGASEQTPQGRSAPLTFDLTTNLFFRNNAQ
jgi:prepilin-type N-terminal cleavage/methylation domain-containing protein